MIQVWCYDTNGFFTESIFVEKVEKNMTNIPIGSIGFYKAKFDGEKWTEGATEEEIKEWEEKNKPKPQEPTKEEILSKEVANLKVENMKKDTIITNTLKSVAELKVEIMAMKGEK